MTETDKEKHIPGGSFIIARKLFRSEVWLKDPLYLKAWLWILGQASHSDHERNGHKYKRGEFATTYDEVIKSISYYHNRQHIIPTVKQARVILKWLESQSMIQVIPIKRPISQVHNSFLTGADPRARTGAYLGIKIVVVNYDTYQDSTSYRGRDKGRPTSRQGHNNNNGYNNGYNNGLKETPDFSAFLSRYENQTLIEQCFSAMASVRKSNKVAESVLIAQLKKWERYPAEQVEAAIKTYLDKDCAGQGKGEAYLLGIIRNQKTVEPVQESTGSPLLDKYYQEQGQTV